MFTGRALSSGSRLFRLVLSLPASAMVQLHRCVFGNAIL